MKNIVPFYFRYLLAAALLVLARVSAVAVDEEYQKQVRKAATQLDALIRANAQNTLEGHPERNQYVFGDASWVQAETGLSYVGAAKIQAINAQLQEFYESTQSSNPPGITYYVYLGVRVNSSGLVFANAEGALAFGEHKSLSEAEIRSKFLEEQEKFTQDVFLVSKLNTTSAILNVTGYFDYWEVNNTPKAEVSFLNVFALGDALLPFFGDIKEEIRSKGDDAKFSKDAEKALTTFVNASVGVFRARSGFVNLYETLAIGSGEKWDQAIMAMASDLDGLVQNNKPYASDFAVDPSKNPFVKHAQVRYVKTAQYFNLETSEAWNRKLAWLEYNTIKFSNTGGKRVYVVFRQIDFLIPADKYSIFANEVLAKSVQTDKNRTAVICIPFYRNTIGEVLTFPAIGIGSSSVFPRDWQTNFAQSTLNQNVSQLISAAYTDLPKPYRNYYYYFRVDGKTIQLSLQSAGDVRGQAAIAELQFSYDKALNDFTAFIDDIASHRTNPQVQLAESVIRTNLLALRQVNSGVSQVTPDLLEEYTDLYHERYVHSYLKEVYGKYFNLALPADNVPRAALVDQTDPVLALLDYYSIILMPTGFDVVPELAGGIYCAVQGEGVQASIYFASAALAGVNSATLRRFIEGAEFIVKDGRLTLQSGALDLVRVTNTATTLSDEVVAALNGLKVNKNQGDGVVDLIVHAEGSKFFAYVDDATGTLGERIELTPDRLAAFIEQLALDGTAPVRLLSCNNLEAARALSQVLPEHTIIATDGLVRVHEDGGITVVARAENSDVAWYEFKNGVRSERPLATPHPPDAAHLDDFVQMGDDFSSRINRIASRLNDPRFSSLKERVALLLDESTRPKFLDDFADAGDDVLQKLNDDASLLDLWKTYSNDFRNTRYIKDEYKACQIVADAYPDGHLGELVKKVMQERKPSNSEVVVVGVTHPKLNGKVFTGRNFRPSEAAEQAIFLSEGIGTDVCHPLLRDRVKYMDFVRTSVYNKQTEVLNTALAHKLLNIEDEALSKIISAGDAGTHGEVRALSKALHELEKEQPVTMESLAEFDMFIRNFREQVMHRCPCCLHISNGVKVLGGL